MVLLRGIGRGFRTGVLLFGGGMIAAPAAAQTVDYGSLEALFGEPVTTTATGKPQKVSEAPVSIEIVTAEKIRRMGVSSLPEVLDKIPGLVSWQGTRSYADVGVRGQNANFNPSLLVLLNGRQVYIDTYGYTDWSLIPVQLEEIRQVEIVKGPTTALYGFNAVSGVVNIVTYNPKYDKNGEAGIVGGTDDYHRAYGFKALDLSDDVSVRFSGSYEGFDEFDLNSDTRFANSPSKFGSNQNRKFLGDGIAQLTDKTQLRLEASYASSEGNVVPLSYYSIPSDKYFRSAKAALVSETSYGLVEANLYTNDHTATTNGDATPGVIHNRIMVAQLQDTFKGGLDHTFRIQGEYRNNSIESTEYVGADSEVSYDVVAAGGMWNWVLTPEIEWTNAVRLDHLMLQRDGVFNSTNVFSGNGEFDQNVTDYSINSGAVWKATDHDTFRVSYGRGVQAPSLLGFGIDLIAGGGVVVAGNPELDTTVVQNYEVGYDRRLEATGGKFRASAFFKRTEDINTLNGAFYLAGGVTPVSQVAVIGDSETVGTEFILDGTVGQSWEWDVSYMYQNSVDSFTDYTSGNPTSAVLRYEDTVPHHTLKGHVGYSTGAWETDLYGQVASNFDVLSYNGTGFDVVKLDSYYTLGGRIGYSFDNGFTLALSGADILRDGTASSYGLENERRAYLSLSKRF